MELELFTVNVRKGFLRVTILRVGVGRAERALFEVFMSASWNSIDVLFIHVFEDER